LDRPGATNSSAALWDNEEPMTLQPIVPARPRPARCAEMIDAHRPTGPPDQSPPVEADFGLSHDAITAELLDPTWQFLTHASPTVRAELGQFVALPTVSTPSPASAPASTAYSSAPHGTTHATHTASEHHKDQQVGPKLASHNTCPHSAGGAKPLPTWGQKSFSKSASRTHRRLRYRDPLPQEGLSPADSGGRSSAGLVTVPRWAV
jgi:hypothetical protein